MGGTDSKVLETSGGNLEANEKDSHDTKLSFSVIDWFAAEGNGGGSGWINAFMLLLAMFSVGLLVWKRRNVARLCANMSDRKHAQRRSPKAETLGKEDLEMSRFKESMAVAAGPTPFYPLLGPTVSAATGHAFYPPSQTSMSFAPPPPPPQPPPPPPYAPVAPQQLQDNTQVILQPQHFTLPRLGDLVGKLVEEADIRAARMHRRRREMDEDYDGNGSGTPRPRARSVSRIARFETPEVVESRSPPGTAEMERRLIRGLSQSQSTLDV